MRAMTDRSPNPPQAPRAFAAAFAVALCVGTAALLPISPALAARLKSDAPQTYTVQPGDTLWSIAGRFLEDPWNWREVWKANSDLRNPDRIYPGDVLRLSTAGGKPSIGVDRGDGSVGSGGMRVVKLTPRVRTSSLKEAIPTIPISSIAPFLTQPYVADSDAIRRANYVVGFPDEHNMAGVGDRVYVRRIDSPTVTSFQILRPSKPLQDPRTNETLGFEALFVANVELERTGDPATLKVVRSEREIAIGDRVIPAAAEEPLANFYPHPGPAGTRGQILSVLDGVTQVGQFDVVVVNLGTKNRVEPGQVFEIFQGGEKERDLVRQGLFDHDWRDETPLSTGFWYGSDQEIRRWRANEPDPNTPFPPTVDVRPMRGTYIAPFERSGVLMIFRSFERVSFGLVLEATRPMHIEDRLQPPPS
jgi:LysM repeat protein